MKNLNLLFEIELDLSGIDDADREDYSNRVMEAIEMLSCVCRVDPVQEANGEMAKIIGSQSEDWLKQGKEISEKEQPRDR